MSVSEILSNAVFYILAIVILVGVHEFGHFYIARLCGVQVLRFSLGFGNVIWRKTDSKGTEFAVSSIPLGGYVRMLDEREGDVPESMLPFAFNRKPLWQRTLIILGGPLANIILAIALTWILAMQGETGLVPTLDKVQPNSVAARMGLESGQEIVAVDGKPTPTARDVSQQLYARVGDTGNLVLRVRYPNSSVDYELSTPIEKWLGDVRNPDPYEALGFEYLVKLDPVVGGVVENSPAAKAGLQAGDKVLSIDGNPISDWKEMNTYIRGHPNQLIEMRVDRAGQEQQISVTPESFKEEGVLYGRVGMHSAPMNDKYLRVSDYSVTEALVLSVTRNWEAAGMQLISLKKLIFREISIKNLSSVPGIAKVAGSSARHGLASFVGFLAMFSLFLGVINLLPIPVLDGGHLVFFVVEFFRGKPVSERVQMIGTQLGLSLVVTLMLVAFYNDIFLS